MKPSASSSARNIFPDLTDAGEILRAAVDVHDAFEQRKRLAVVRVDAADDFAFRASSGAAASRAR